MENEIQLNVSLLGLPGVGKTSLIERFSRGTFMSDTLPTSLDFTKVRLRVEGDTVAVNIVDNAGVEHRFQMARSLNQRADGLILVYDVTKKLSFDNLDTFLEYINEVCEENVQIIVVGNKVDMHYCDKEVSNEDIVNYAKDKNAVFMETSALDDYNVNEVFFRLIKMILKAQGMLIPGCEDPVISHKDRKSVPVDKESLKKVLVSRKKRQTDIVRVTNVSSKPKESSCPC